MAHQKRVGRKVKGRNCEAFPNGGVIAMDKALTQRLIKKGDYKKVRWNQPAAKHRSDPDGRNSTKPR